MKLGRYENSSCIYSGSIQASLLHWEKFLGTVTKNLVVKIVFNNSVRVEITWSFL